MDQARDEITVLIVEDDGNYAAAVARAIDGDGIRVSRVVPSAEDAFEWLAARECPRIVLMDLNLPGMSGILATASIKERFPAADVIIQTIFEDPDVILSAIRAGASGYVLKGLSTEELRLTIRETVAGGARLTGKIARSVLAVMGTGATRVNAGAARACGLVSSLSPREEEILRALMSGASNKAIADRLCVSVNTVGTHLKNIYAKLRVSSRSEAVALAAGIVPGARVSDISKSVPES